MNATKFMRIMRIKGMRKSRSAKVVALLKLGKATTEELITLIGGEYRPAVSEARADGHNIVCSKYKTGDGRWIFEYTYKGQYETTLTGAQ